MREWLKDAPSRDRLLSLHGVGPKTYDYVCCLVGIDRIAVDRHVKSFASEAGVTITGYDDLQVVVSYAAYLLGLPRREFDAWIWRLRAPGVAGSATDGIILVPNIVEARNHLTNRNPESLNGLARR